MWIYLNSNGIITSSAFDSENFYKDSVGVASIYAYRNGAELSEYTSVKIQFKYSDNTYSPEVNMVKGVEVEFPSELASQGSEFVAGNTYNVCAYYFNVAGYLGVAGLTVATITYYKSGVIDKTATISFYITDTVSDEEQTITTTQYAELQLDIVDRWKRFVGTNEEIEAESKDNYTLYFSTDNNELYYYDGENLLSTTAITFAIDSSNSIYSISNSSGTYYPTKCINFNYTTANQKRIMVSTLTSGGYLTSNDINANYIYHNIYDNQLYIFRAGMLWLCGALQNLFVLTYDDEISDYTYMLNNEDIPALIEAASEGATNYIVFEFSGGNYDGRRYLVNYNYNEDEENWDFVCVDININSMGATSAGLCKFTLNDITADYQYDGEGTWYEVSLYGEGKYLNLSNPNSLGITVYLADGSTRTFTSRNINIVNAIGFTTSGTFTCTRGYYKETTIKGSGLSDTLYELLTDLKGTIQ